MMIPMVLLAGCGDDPISKSKFVTQMTKKTPAIGETEWSCVYDELDGDADVLDRLVRLEFGSPVPADLSERVSKLLADCAAAKSSLPTTTAPSG